MARPSARTAAGLATVAALAVSAALGRPPPTDNSVESLLGGRAARAYETFRSSFGADELTLVSISGGPLPALLDHLERTHAVLRAQPELTLVITASTAFPETLRALSDPELGGPDALPGARATLSGPLNAELGLLDLEVPRARLVAASDPGTPPKGLFEALERARAAAERDGLAFHVAGTAPLNAAIDRAGRQIEERALPGVIGLAAVLLLLAVRRVRVVIALLAAVGLVVFGVDAVYGALGGTNDVLVVIHRPVALVLILASGVHLVEAWRSHPDDPAAAARHTGPAIRLALLTTAVGFGTLAVSPLPPIRNFGLLSAACLLVAMPVMLGALPALFRWLRPPPRGRGDPAERAAVFAVGVGVRYRKTTLTLAALVILGGLAAGLAVPIDTHAINYFEPDSPIRRDHEAIEDSGLGLQSLEVLLEFSSPWQPEPDAVNALDAFARDVVALDGVLTRFDPALILLEAGHRVTGRAVPPDPLTLERVWSDDQPWKRATIAGEGRRVRASFLIETLDAEHMDRLGEQIGALAATHLDLSREEVVVTGNYRLLLEAQRSLLKTLLWSLALTAAVMQLVLGFALRSARLGLAAMMPNLIPVATIFIAMFVLGLPLDLGTCMVASLSLAIAVDDTLHFCLAERRFGASFAAQRTGRAILMTSLIMGLGFAMLIPSEFRPTSAFGLLSALALAAAVVGDLVVLPAVLKQVGGGSRSLAAPPSAEPGARG